MVPDSTGGQAASVKKLPPTSSEELVDRAYVDNAIAQLEKRIEQQLSTLVQQEMAKLKEDILQTVVRLIPEDFPQNTSSAAPLQRLSSGSELSSGESRRSSSMRKNASSKSGLKKEEKAKKKEEKEKKKAEKEREKEVKKERRKSLSMLKKAGVEKRSPFMAEV